MNTTKVVRAMWRNNPGWPKDARACFRNAIDDVDELVEMLREFTTHAECPCCGEGLDADGPLDFRERSYELGHDPNCKLAQFLLVQG